MPSLAMPGLNTRQIPAALSRHHPLWAGRQPPINPVPQDMAMIDKITIFLPHILMALAIWKLAPSRRPRR
jgi:hypothetical protein